MNKDQPDVTSDMLIKRDSLKSKLKKVGMESVEVPVRLELPEAGSGFQVASADIYVNLDSSRAKGIHMSRLYISLHKNLESQPLSFKLIRQILSEFLVSHKGLSTCSYLNLRFDLPLERKSLISSNKSWRKYPVEIIGKYDGKNFDINCSFGVLYSSTCPCSAALSRQLIQQHFLESFKVLKDNDQVSTHDIFEWLGEEKNILATPHSQRSKATVTVKIQQQDLSCIENYINMVEEGLQTPVQGIVKREDEQAFAKQNGQNLMFAEDACRTIKAQLASQPDLEDFQIKVSHYESLHPHNAVSYASKSF
ncbi:MAG: GTP cyclohydrolase I FolE2 [Zetaproteobacteria bacterium]|nr:GTP cyclohydrolase I FolE2 [Pseudobdellovibrionaceae bacterium]